jgi:hypothetical protein
MTKFTDELFDDLLREHGPMLASIKVPAAPRRHLATRPVLLTAGAGGLAVVATVGTLVAGGGTPAYAVTTHPDGTVSLAVYQKSGIAGANAKLHQIGDGRVVVVPAAPGCPSISSLPAVAVPGGKVTQQSGRVAVPASKAVREATVQVTQQGGKVTARASKAVPEATVQLTRSTDGSTTMDARSIPADGILVLAYSTTASGMKAAVAVLTSGPVPSCVSIPSPPAGGSGAGIVGGHTGAVPAKSGNG